VIIGDELRLWARDRSRQRNTEAGIEAFRTAWGEGPVRQHFAALFARRPDRSAAGLTAAILDLFSSDAWVDVLVDRIAAGLREDPFFLPPFQALRSEISSGLVIHDDDHVTVTAGVTGVTDLAVKKSAGRGGSINFSGQVTVLKFVRAGGAVLSFWEAPRIGEDFAASAAGTCRRTGRRAIADGEVLVIDGRAHSYVIDHARRNILVLQAILKADQAPLGVEYDAASGAYLGCSAVDDADSRIQMIATLARKLGHREAFEAIAPFTAHARFFVRWHAMRELIGIDARAALPRLRTMARGDPHPDVQRAAQATLEQLDRAGIGRKAA
jgi:hypothetical protein